jgi:hypothetical protein
VFFCLQVTNENEYLKKLLQQYLFEPKENIRHDIEGYHKLSKNLFCDMHRNKIGMGYLGRSVFILNVNHSNALEGGPMVECYEGIRRQSWDSHRCC